MHHRLGRFVPAPEQQLAAIVRQLHRLTANNLRASVRSLSNRDLRSCSDLLEVLPGGHPDRVWLDDVYDRAQYLAAGGAELRLWACEHRAGESGETAVVFVDWTQVRAVGPRDQVAAGVAVLRAAGGPVQVMPRLFRKICSNGAVVDAGNGAGTVCAAASAGDLFAAALAPEVFATATSRLAAMRSVRLSRELAQGVNGLTLDDPRLQPTAEDGGATAFGYMNAATAAAHFAGSWSERLAAERRAVQQFARFVDGHDVAPIWQRYGVAHGPGRDVAFAAAAGDAVCT